MLEDAKTKQNLRRGDGASADVNVKNKEDKQSDGTKKRPKSVKDVEGRKKLKCSVLVPAGI